MKIIFEENLSGDNSDVEEQDISLDFIEVRENSMKISPRRQIDLMLENKRLMLTIKEVYDI